MSKENVPFYTQAEILDKYIKKINAEDDKEIIEVILDVLRDREDLRNYFFRSRPNPEWAPILWENNFFDTPPATEEKDGGIISFPYWDVQNYLINVAEDASDIVIKHIQTITSNSFYIAHAIRAICKIDPNKAVLVKERIVSWLDDSQIAGGILDVVYDYMVCLIQGKLYPEAFEIYQELSKPRLFKQYSVRKTRQTPRGPVISLYENIPQLEYHEINAIEEFQKIYPDRTCQLLHNNLAESLQLEGESIDNPEFEFSSWWRVAIEDTGQDLGDSAKEQILKRYVNSLHFSASSNFSNFKEQILDLLNDERKIFYRIGLYFLRHYPDEFKSSIETALIKSANLDDTEITHEYYLLLEVGYPFLPESSRINLYNLILSGPPQDRIEKRKAFYLKQLIDSDYSLNDYIKIQNNLWIRSRLWMIRSHLSENQKQKLDKLVDEYGEPEHPAYFRWISETGFMPTTSPISGDKLIQLSPKNLIKFIRNWKPESDQEKLYVDENIEGLAKEVAKIVYENTANYQDIISELAVINPLYASELLFYFQNSEEISPVQWQILIYTSKILLDVEKIRVNDKWRWVRQCMVNLIEIGFQNEKKLIPHDLLNQTRDILLTLINDPDPTPDDESIPKMGKFEIFSDPITIGLNRVRPSVIRTLIIYSIYRVNEVSPEIRLEEEIKKGLQEKLDKTVEKSLSVSSVFGEYFTRLCWLNREWAEENINNIFPEISDEESLWLFQSAWDGFMINMYYPDLNDILKPYYLIAADNISEGLVTRDDVLDRFAYHLVFDFLFCDYLDDSYDNSQIPLFRYVRNCKEKGVPEVGIACYKIIQKNKDKIDDWWPKIRRIWEWRINVAIASNHSSNYDQEIRKFARLLECSPEEESINMLYPIIEGTIPHISNITHRDIGWDSVENFLAKQVEKYPLVAIQVYRMMREQRGAQYIWQQETDNAYKIIKTSAEKAVSRKEALSLIDYLGSMQNDEFKSIYERFAQ